MEASSTIHPADRGPLITSPVMVATCPDCQGLALARPLGLSDRFIAACFEPGRCWWSGTLERAQVLDELGHRHRDRPLT